MLVVILTLCLTGCSSEKRHCPEFDAAEAVFDRLADETGDPTFSDPAFIAAAERYEAISSSCVRSDRAAAAARMLRNAQKSRRQSEKRLKEMKIGPQKRRGNSLNSTREAECPSVYCEAQALQGTHVYKTFCMSPVLSAQAAAHACITWVNYNGPEGETLRCVCR